ncbi:hypothetical protein BSL78_18413 [Apostichopus japonicus]|uniref:Uncharacterized protein n=1 Tax=Stichopus japonicus TaxID=307972 RepID=A0A2G8K9Q3_STIJA|nr:hypothetical protein BSL78_18413 [Apostichopus japonicus]
MRGKDLSVVMDSPPAYQSQEPSKTKLYVIAVTVTIVTLMVLSFGVFYSVFFAQNPKVVNNLTTGDGDQVVIIKNMMMIKNLTTSACYFISLDNIPVDMDLDNEDQMLPMFFHEVYDPSDKLLTHTNTTIVMIPAGDIMTTNTDQCIDSIRIEPKNSQRTRKVRRDPRDREEEETADCGICFIIFSGSR